ncbi:hypothetical protein [Rhodoplanes azumiensis]|uniref:Uncharacterized protein n=1 Tax=Rhodoplanes azumiensis TaxID=1897628 RepID=A0ABW5AI47_9BRAD
MLLDVSAARANEGDDRIRPAVTRLGGSIEIEIVLFRTVGNERSVKLAFTRPASASKSSGDPVRSSIDPS